MGHSPFNIAKTYSFSIPKVIPSSAKEVLIYARMWSVHCPKHADFDIKIYTREGHQRFEKYMFVVQWTKDAHTSTDNMWFPMPSDRRLYVNIPYRRSNCGALWLSAIGYR
jgi:hypothetical protein